MRNSSMTDTQFVSFLKMLISSIESAQQEETKQLTDQRLSALIRDLETVINS